MRKNVPLSVFTTLRVGGSARFFTIAKNEDEIKRSAAYATERNLPVFILGGGSNILVSDDGFLGLVIKIETKGITYDGCCVKVASGENWDSFVLDTISKGLWGLENLSGIPGTVGAAPIQNIGAYGVEVKDFIESVKVLDLKTNGIKIFSNAECRFEYRDSVFKKPEGKNLVILEVTFRLSREPKPNISYKDLAEYFRGASGKESLSLVRPPERAPTYALETFLSGSAIRTAVLEIRTKKFPDIKKVGTAGSFFKNPIISEKEYQKLKSRYPDISSFPAKDGVKIPLAFILDKICGLKGYKKGNIELFQNQPLVLVNSGGATAKEIMDFDNEIKNFVLKKTGVRIYEEVICMP